MCKKVISNLIWILVALALTILAVKAAYIQRGYRAYGGEYLVFIMVMIVRELVGEITTAWKMVSWTEDDDESGEYQKDSIGFQKRGR